jgi:hypothetical protein
MKNKIVLFALLTGLGAQSFALTFTGSISYTFQSVSPNVPGVSVGDTFEGTYTYESPTVDGTFFGGIAGDTLVGEVTIPAPFNPLGITSPISLDAQASILTVSGGQVSDFFWHPTLGPTDLNMDFATFSVSTSAGDEAYTGRGTVSFSAPRLQPVPDSGNSAFLMFGALALLSFWAKTGRHSRPHGV